ncbi:hypothetical protein [Micromonospora sp. NBC_01638]|uniref:hypothetical protein n=1 Tax=Micromonospora sp. NBC_01638 TaxID=2975982 RepID=UPI00386AB3F7|nr:hypothetical protein OG811_09745 [Micromonospora sp. NBC_01638]
MRFATVSARLAAAAAVAGSAMVGVTPAQAATTSTIVCQETKQVEEASYDVNSGCSLKDGDRVQISAYGQIWAGVWFTGENGPQGWTNMANDSKFPMTNARAFSLLAKTNGNYRSVGTGTMFTYYGTGSPLYLRINDDKPGNGNGAFTADVTVTRG